MAVSGVAATVTFGVWDTGANNWKTGDAANLTLRLVADGTASTPSGTAAEVDATNLPGQYKLALAGSENTGTAMELCGKSSTSGCIIIPATWHNTAVAVSTPPTAAAIADAVWDEAATGHTDAGKAGAQVWTDIDTIAGDVAGLDGDAMRGTDDALLAANYTAPPTAVAVAVQVWANATGAAVAGTLSGITSLGAWLRGLYRKSAMNATAKAEVNTGGGTYDETTDSVEAIRDRGDAAWVSAAGAGAVPVVVTVTDGTDPQAGVQVTLQSQVTGAAVAGPVTTDENGQATFNRTAAEALTEAPTSTTLLSGGDTDFTVGSASTAVTCVMTSSAVPTPAPAGYCAVRCVAERRTDTAASGRFRLVSGSSPDTRDAGGVTVTLVDGREDEALVGGEATINILRGAVVTLQLETPGDTITKRNVTIPDAATADWNDL